MIDGSSPFASTYDLANIITLYQQRNCKIMNLFWEKHFIIIVVSMFIVEYVPYFHIIAFKNTDL